MARKYRVKRTPGRSDRQGETGQEAQSPGLARWFWAGLGAWGLLFVVAIGISSSEPLEAGLALRAASFVARIASALAGSLSTVFSFALILTSIVKLSRSGQKLRRFLAGFWTSFIFFSGVYHDFRVPGNQTFLVARAGGGAGILGACLDRLFRLVFGFRPLAVTCMFFGLASGISLMFNQSAWTPAAYIWMLALTGWQRFNRFLGDFFAEHGPSEDELECEAVEQVLGRKGKARTPNETDEDAATGELRRLEEQAYGEDDEPFEPPRAAERPRFLRSTRREETSGQPERRTSITPEAGLPADERPDSPSKYAHDMETRETMEQPPLTNLLFYQFPPIDILQKSEAQKKARPSQDLEERARTIEKTLMSFGVVAKVVNYTQGPAVTRFELQPGPGVKVASIVNLSQDLALALAAPDVRLEAPIPGKSAVGIEVPNKDVSVVHLRDVIESREFRNSPSPLTVALGKDISGRPVVTSLDHCLHLLIAGATGAGKSVCINCIIASLMYKARPDQVKLLLIDPKKVELSVWSKIPHLIAPVVWDPKKAAGALRWAVKEMESRYEKFTRVGTRDIERYNQVATPPDSAQPAMPYIVIIIDELSDLMMVAPAEVEDAIFRLAQMARASGIYLVVATQRPSVDVLTGTIKANIPSRIAFAVASQIDSRTILDMAGAEKLLGRGDMLFFPVGASKPLRAQGCYISEREIDELVSFVSAQARPQFAPGILTEPDSTDKDQAIADDPLFAQALRIVVEARQASVSLLQRRLPIGYSRAARLIDAMEAKGYVGPYEGSKPREVRLTMQEYLRRFASGDGSGQEDGPERAPQRANQGAQVRGPRSAEPMESRLKNPKGDDAYGDRRER